MEVFLQTSRNWVITQPNKDWENSSLDNDFIGDGILYSPENCVYISKKLNGFITDRANDRGDYLVGVTWHKHRKRFIAQCANPFGTSNYEKEKRLYWRFYHRRRSSRSMAFKKT